jgi:hypothetical protein
VAPWMCEDCERSMEAVLEDKGKCRCARCRAGGYVLPISRPVGERVSPWCVACHHYLLTGRERGT